MEEILKNKYIKIKRKGRIKNFSTPTETIEYVQRFFSFVVNN